MWIVLRVCPQTRGFQTVRRGRLEVGETRGKDVAGERDRCMLVCTTDCNSFHQNTTFSWTHNSVKSEHTYMTHIFFDSV